MKIYLCSDVHIEFGQLEVHNKDNADVLILSGDIVVADAFKEDNIKMITLRDRFIQFFASCSSQFKDVIYVMGNHEHYHGDFATTASILRKVLEPFPNIHLLDKQTKTVDDVTFIGGTLWTDMNKEDPNTMFYIQRGMNDFRIVENSNRMVSYRVYEDADRSKVNFHKKPSTFSPADAVEDHKAMLAFIDEVTKDQTKKYVVVGHHAPSRQSTKPRYQGEHLMNGGYSSDLSEFILDRPSIKMWTHGHTHSPFEYMIGSTLIVCNPRGYIDYEPDAYDFDFKLLEI